MKTLSIRQPWANLIVHGIKDIENRTWKTNFRGVIYIHAPGKDDSNNIVMGDDRVSEIHKYGVHSVVNRPTSSIIGTVEIVDCIKDSKSIWADHDCWHWVLKDPIIFRPPIKNIKGKLSLWDFDPRDK